MDEIKIDKIYFELTPSGKMQVLHINGRSVHLWDNFIRSCVTESNAKIHSHSDLKEITEAQATLINTSLPEERSADRPGENIVNT